jgi:hypothetical protein
VVLIFGFGQFEICPSLEGFRALQVRDLLIGFHSEAWEHRTLQMELEAKQIYCSFAILKYQVFRKAPTYKVN